MDKPNESDKPDELEKIALLKAKLRGLNSLKQLAKSRELGPDELRHRYMAMLACPTLGRDIECVDKRKGSSLNAIVADDDKREDSSHNAMEESFGGSMAGAVIVLGTALVLSASVAVGVRTSSVTTVVLSVVALSSACCLSYGFFQLASGKTRDNVDQDIESSIQELSAELSRIDSSNSFATFSV